MAPEAFGIDELSFVDDPVDCLVVLDELKQGGESAAFAFQRVCFDRKRWSDGDSHPFGHVANERLEHRLLAVEIGIEGAQRDLGAAGDADDRAFAKPSLAELFQCRVEDLAKSALAARRARRLSVACGGWSSLGGIAVQLARSRQSPPLLHPLLRAKLKAGSGFITAIVAVWQ